MPSSALSSCGCHIDALGVLNDAFCYSIRFERYWRTRKAAGNAFARYIAVESMLGLSSCSDALFRAVRCAFSNVATFWIADDGGKCHKGQEDAILCDRAVGMTYSVWGPRNMVIYSIPYNTFWRWNGSEFDFIFCDLIQCPCMATTGTLQIMYFLNVPQ